MNEEFDPGAREGGPPQGEPARPDEPRSSPGPQGPLGEDPNLRRPRRRGRRGRGGGGPVPFRGPQQGGFRPSGPFRGPPRGPALGGRGPDDESSLQARELAAYERRQQQAQRRSTGGWRPGAPFRAPAGPRRFGGGPRYEEQVRRATAGPARGAAPSHEAGEPIAGPHAVLEAIRAGRAVRKLYVSQDRGLRTGAVNELIAEAQERRIFVNYVDKLEIARLSPIEDHQGVVAIVEGRAGVELEELLLHLDALAAPALVLAIDTLQDPQNFGVLLPSAEGAGVDGVVIPRHRSVGLTVAVARTSAGASEHLLVADVANLRQALDALKERGLWIVGAAESGDLLYDEVDYRGATAIVIGGEGEGIRRLVLEGCDQVVRIPMEGRVSSLNAAAAGTVILYEALRQRRRDAAPPGTRTPRLEPTALADAAESADLAEEGAALATDEVLEDEPETLDEAAADDPATLALEPKVVPKRPAAKKTAARKSPRKPAEG